MKIKNGFILRKVGIQHIVAATGEVSKEFNGMMRLNESGAFAFRTLQAGATMEELVAAITAEYDVSEAQARQDAEGFVAALREAGALE